MSTSESTRIPTEPVAIPPRPTVITPVVRGEGSCLATLVVNQEDPFFFDHPLDHVSEMLLLTGLLDVVRADTDPDLGGGRVRLSLRFNQLCELHPAVVLHARPGPGGRLVGAVQDGQPVCTGSVELFGDAFPPAHEPREAAVVRPIRSELVHQRDPANVVLGEPAIDAATYRVPLRTPDATHFLLRDGPRRYGIEELIEGGRQFASAACHLAHQRPPQVCLLWTKLVAELPVAADRSSSLALRWAIRPPSGDWSAFDFVLTDDGDRELGYLSFLFKCMSPTELNRR